MFKLGRLVAIAKHMKKFPLVGTLKEVIETDAPKIIKSRVDRLVNARGKGVVFRRIGGRIVPIRKK